jgi:hypothetical protein
MKTVKSILVELVLPFIVCWFFMSLLIDVVAIPTVFKNISNLEEGGRIGMIVFGRFNRLEIFFATFILLGVFSYKEKSLLILALSFILLAFSLFYTFFMTPIIAETSIKIHQLNIIDPQYKILSKQHNYYHAAYRYFDTVKLLLLLFFSFLIIHLNIKRIHKECV